MLSNLKYLSASLFVVLAASCGDTSDPYIDPNPLPDTDLEPIKVDILHIADSVFANEYPESTFLDAKESVPSDPLADNYEDFFENSTMYSEGTRDVVITYRGDEVSWVFEDDDKDKSKNVVKISADGAHVTIHNEEADGRARMNYILKGESSNGSLRVYSKRKFMITLSDVNLTNAKGAAISVQKSADEKKRVFLCLDNASQNQLCDGEEYTTVVEGESDKGTIFTEGKLVIFGKGSLQVQSLNNHAIASDDDIYIHSGVRLSLKADNKDGLHSKDKIVMGGGLVQISADKDALQCDTISKGFTMTGGRLLAAGKRAVTAYSFVFSGGEFALVGKHSLLPDTPDFWKKSEFPEGYLIVKGKK